MGLLCARPLPVCRFGRCAKRFFAEIVWFGAEIIINIKGGAAQNRAKQTC